MGVSEYFADEALAPDELNLRLSVMRAAEGVFSRTERKLLWHKLGLPSPVSVPAGGAVTIVTEEGDAFACWAAECLEVTGAAERIKTAALHAAFQNWCDQAGEPPLSLSSFGKRLGKLGVRGLISNGSWRVGVRLRPFG